MERIITCKNTDGVKMTFRETSMDDPFILVKADGIYDAEYDVATSKNTLMPGSTYLGTNATEKYIVLTLKDRSNFAADRDLLDELFKEGDEGTLIVSDEHHLRQISYYVEKLYSDAIHDVRHHTISLKCPDPRFYATGDAIVRIGDINKAWEFPHNFLAVGEEFGFRSTKRIRTITNRSSNDNVGMVIDITGSGDVTNPSVTIVETQETIKVGDSNKPFTLHVGEILRITTSTGDKHIYHIIGDMQEEINHYLADGSVFIQLSRGDNNIGYNADAGVQYMSIDIKYRLQYARA